MFLKNKKSLITFLVVIFATTLLCFGAIDFTQSANKAYAYNYKYTEIMPTGENAIANIYDDGFNAGNLNALAQKANYKDLNAMITAAESGATKNAADFGHSTVKFGKAENGEGDELVWIPAYLSDSAEGAILTLWLAGTMGTSKNDTNKWTENASFCNDATPNPSSNNYSTSYIRAAINNGGDYYGEWSTANKNPTKKHCRQTTSTNLQCLQRANYQAT